MTLIRNCEIIFKKQFMSSVISEYIIKNQNYEFKIDIDIKLFLELLISNSLFYPRPSLSQEFEYFLT